MNTEPYDFQYFQNSDYNRAIGSIDAVYVKKNLKEYLKTTLDIGTVLTTLFSSLLTNRPNNLECYVTLGNEGLPRTITLDYWAQSLAMKRLERNEEDGIFIRNLLGTFIN